MRMLFLVGLAIAVFLAMEVVSYATHRWVMHRLGMRWHRSHHAPPHGRWEANDVFPAVFSAVGFGIFLTAAITHSAIGYAIAIGVTAYGLAYAFLHEIVIHRRISVRTPAWPYLHWVRDAHGIHHAFGGEPYGMLLPVVSSALRERARARSGPSELERDDRRASMPRTRQRL